MYDARLDAIEQDLAQPVRSEERLLAIRSLATGVDTERMLSDNYIPAWLDREDDWLLAFETGYRAESWSQDVGPFELNALEDIREMIPS